MFSVFPLDPRLVEKRVWPAINIPASGTRTEELLLDPKELEKTASNGVFLMTMNLA